MPSLPSFSMPYLPSPSMPTSFPYHDLPFHYIDPYHDTPHHFHYIDPLPYHDTPQ